MVADDLQGQLLHGHGVWRYHRCVHCCSGEVGLVKRPGQYGARKSRQTGDCIGASNITGAGLHPNYHHSRCFEVGDSVIEVHGSQLIPAGAVGKIIRFRGLGRVVVQFESGVVTTEIRYLHKKEKANE